jgi:hypothetical protein
MHTPPDRLEGLFTAIEMNAHRVAVFAKFERGEPLTPEDQLELAAALKELGLFELAHFVARATPTVLEGIAQANDVFAKAKAVRALWDSIMR